MKEGTHPIIRTISLLAAGLATACSTATASGTAAGGHHASLLESRNLFPLRIGFDIKAEKREVEFHGGRIDEMRARYYTGYMGYDIVPWMTIFGTAGALETARDADADYAQPGFIWSAGLRMALWRIDIRQPAFMTGRLSMSLGGEYSRKRSGGDTPRSDWSEYFGALYVGYEIFTKDPPNPDEIPYSIVFFVAPCLSRLDGQRSNDGLPDEDFNEKELFGVMGGIEVFIARNLSAAGQIQYIGRPGFGGSLRYQF